MATDPRKGSSASRAARASSDRAGNVRAGSDRTGDEQADAELIAQIARGDRAALHVLYIKYHASLLRFAYRITGRTDLAQEVVNDVMLVVWQDAATFEGRSRPSTWIIGIAYRKALRASERARRWYRRFCAADFAMATELRSNVEALNRHAEPDPVELQDLLEHALRSLPAGQRAVVELTYFFGCSYDEIAQIIDCPVNTVKTRMFHARAKLKALLPHLGKDDLA